MRKEEIDCTNDLLEQKIHDAFQNLRNIFGTHVIAAGHITNIVHGCLVIVHVYQKIQNPF